jgi:methylenetetrahydrofolate dehydrogenase (NADP+)/methenyltetrahydrofolate cyclohydrolase
MRSDTHRLPETTSQDELSGPDRRSERRPGIHGILVQLPLPKHRDRQQRGAGRHPDPDKDVDG